MDTFFTFFRKIVTAVVFTIFAFAMVYIPQPFNQVQPVEAAATEVTQIGNLGALGGVLAGSAKTLIKEITLDGIAWAVAQSIVSSMVRSTVNWINSGFKGSPAFISDLDGFLLDAADRGFGEFIASINELGSFICEPFRIQVSIALEIDYQATRGGALRECRLTDIVGNLENFLSGDFNTGGWNNFVNVVSRPQMYTPYGSVLTARNAGSVRLVNARGQVLEELNWGDGFLSSKVCEAIEGTEDAEGEAKERCVISTPGKFIQEALTFNTDSGRQSLIQADEINELVGSLIGGLANQAITGTAGLLGLSPNTGFTAPGYSGGSFLGSVDAEGVRGIGSGPGSEAVSEALAVQREYRALADSYIPRFEVFIASSSAEQEEITLARQALRSAQRISEQTNEFIPLLENILSDYQALETEFNAPNTTNVRKTAIRRRQSDIIASFRSLGVYTENQLETSSQQWSLLSQ